MSPNFKASMLVLAALVLAAVTFQAHAVSFTMSWTNATVNEDGTPIPATGPGALTFTRAEVWTCNAGSPVALQLLAHSATVPATQTTYDTPDLPPIEAGTPDVIYCFRAFHINGRNAESASSNLVRKTAKAPKLGNPKFMTVVERTP
jgi:hypothetical protein